MSLYYLEARKKNRDVIINPIQDGSFRGCSRMGEGGGGGAKSAPLSKIYHTYPTTMKLFLSEISKFCYIKKY